MFYCVYALEKKKQFCSASDLQHTFYCCLRNGGFQDRYHGHLPRHDPQVCDGKIKALLFLRYTAG